MIIEELKIPMPWGFIAAKAWGDSSCKPVILSHGIIDNAGVFDTLIPLLPKSFYYICIDLPSHGRSSHLPPYFPIYTLNFVMVYKLVLDYFQRKKYILLGHSFGAAVCLYFARIYPEYVDQVISLDLAAVHHIEPKDFKNFLVKRFNSLIEKNEKTKTGHAPTYTREQIIETVRNARLNEPLTVEAAAPIVERMIDSAGDGKYTLTTDRRLSTFINPFHDYGNVVETLRLFPVQCPCLIILGKKSPPFITDMHKTLPEIEKWGNTEMILLDCGHDVHLYLTDIVAFHITQFLLKLQSKL